MTSASSLAIAGMVLGACWTNAVAAEEEAGPTTPSWLIEQHVGLDDPLGVYGLALVHDRGNWFSAGVGVGLDSVQGSALVTASLFQRTRLVRKGGFALDVGAIFSRGGYSAERRYEPPHFYGSDTVTWTWIPDYRLTATLGLAVDKRHWSLRFEPGLAYHFTRPSCRYATYDVDYAGSCDSPAIPAPYHFGRPPGTIAPSLSITFGYRLGVEDREVSGLASYRSPETALKLSFLSTTIPTMVGVTLLRLWISSYHEHNDAVLAGGLVGLGLGMGLGPAVGYAYSGQHVRGVGVAVLRLLGVGVGVVTLYAMGVSGDGGGGAILGVGMLAAAVVSTIYDVGTSAKAARRHNAGQTGARP